VIFLYLVFAVVGVVVFLLLQNLSFPIRLGIAVASALVPAILLAIALSNVRDL